MKSFKGFKLTLSAFFVVLMMSTVILSAFAGNKDSGVNAFLEIHPRNAQDNIGTDIGEDSSAQEAACSVITSFTPVSSGVKIQFTACEGASAYSVCVKDELSWIVIGTTTETSFIHNISKNNSTYTYTVVALDSSGESIGSYNEYGWTNTYFSSPVLKNIKTTQSGLVVSWNAVEGAFKYRVFVKNGSYWKTVGTTSETSFTDTNVESGKKYKYTVRCINDDGSNNTSYFDKNGISKLFLATPEILKITNTAEGAKISWGEVEGAAKYRVYYKTGNGWKYIGATDKTTLVHKITQSNSTYVYTVRAADSTGDYFSDYDRVGKSNTFIATPELKTKNTTKGIRISWNAVEGASKYKVFVRNGSSWKAVCTTKSTSFTHTDVTSGKRYQYTVRCVSADEKTYTSYYNTKGISPVYLSAPKGVKFSNVETGAKITWSKVTGADKYKVYVKNGTDWKYLGSTKTTSFIHKKAITNTKYTYTIIASNVNSGYSSAYYPDGFSHLFIAAPAFSSVSYKNGGYLLKWNAVPGVSEYRVYRKTSTSSWKFIADVNGTQYVDKTAKKTGIYMYTFRCLNENSKFISGYRTDNPYYYNGKLAGNTIIGNSKDGYHYVGTDGIICESEEIQLAVDFLMKYGKGDTFEEKLETAFMYMARNYPYNRSYDHPKKASDLGPLAADIFKNKKGNCFRQASALACLARVAGYRARVVVGETVSASSGEFVPHGWTEIYVNGKWLVCDMNAQMRYSYLCYYMLDYHYWTIKPINRYEVVVSGGKAIWK